jgi:hypothetical protein
MPTPSPKPDPKKPPKGPYKYKTTVVKEGPFKGATMKRAMSTKELNAEKAAAPAGTSVWRDPSVGYDGPLPNIPGVPGYKKPKAEKPKNMLASRKIQTKPSKGRKA